VIKSTAKETKQKSESRSRKSHSSRLKFLRSPHPLDPPPLQPQTFEPWPPILGWAKIHLEIREEGDRFPWTKTRELDVWVGGEVCIVEEEEKDW